MKLMIEIIIDFSQSKGYAWVGDYKEIGILWEEIGDIFSRNY